MNLKRNDRNDVDQLFSHAQNRRDVFISNDTTQFGSARKRACLKRLGITMLTPEQFVFRWDRGWFNEKGLNTV